MVQAAPEPGGRFAAWVRSDHPRPYNSFGNGSAMRVSPCGWLSGSRREVLQNARLSAACTHSHPEGIRGAVCVADCIYHARTGAGKPKMAELARAEYGYRIGTTCDRIRESNSFNETCQVTVPQAIVCFLESTGFEDAVRLAVSIGGDSDTIAAITGSIAEAHYGGVPGEMAARAMAYLPGEMADVVNGFIALKH